MKNIRDLAIEKGVTRSEIINIIKEWGRTATPSQKLNDTEIAIISSRLDALPKKELNSYFGNLQNRFIKTKQSISFEKYPILAFHFYDDEAIKICKRVVDVPTNSLADKFSKDTSNYELKYSLHKVAENSLDFYGGLLITYVLSLKLLANATPQTQIFKSDTSKKYDPEDFSLRDIVFKDENNNDLIITFRRNTNYGQKTNFAFAVLKRKEDNKKEVLYSFSDLGYLIESFIDKIPPLTLFYTPNSVNGTFYFGYSTNNCFICGKELTDPQSIIYGIGPNCKANFPLYFS